MPSSTQNQTMSALPSKSVAKKLTKTLPAVEAPVVAVPVVEAPKKAKAVKAAATPSVPAAAGLQSRPL